MGAQPGEKRRRGVRASRARVTRALTAAGLRTQAALAERIADLEGLETPPRDIVNRVFREVPVDPRTLERVARALGVEAWSLYKTGDESGDFGGTDGAGDGPGDTTGTGAGEGVPPTPGAPAGRRPLLRRPGGLAVAGIAAGLVLAAVLVLLREVAPPSVEPPGEGGTGPALAMGADALVVRDFRGGDGALAAALREALGRDFRVATAAASALAGELPAPEAAARLRADAVVDGEVVRVGRLAGIRVWLSAGERRRQIWAESLPAVALAARQRPVAARIALAVRRATGLRVPEDAPSYFPLAPVQDDYLRGSYFLGREASELNLGRARSHFEAAVRADPNYARAHAGLCQAILAGHWMEDEGRALRQAAMACGQALQLDPADPEVQAARAHFLHRTGRTAEAIEVYEGVLADHPGDAGIMAALASTLLDAYRQDGDRSRLERARALARGAADADPGLWQPLSWLALMAWADGDVAAAIAAAEEARERDENATVLGNLGTLYLCAGAYRQARSAYLRARELAPETYVADEFLGTVAYFLGEFAEAARLQRRALDRIALGEPEIHQMWGALGDSLRQLGKREEAIDAYLRAIEIAERDQLRGTAPVDDEAARAYYYTRLHGLDPDRVPERVLQEIDARLDRIAAGVQTATARRRLAETYLLRGETDKAREQYRSAIRTCKGYGGLPDLQPLRDPAPVARP